MINFRYHVVSITSVFLALAIGLVLGTAALNGPVADDLNDRLSSLRKSNNGLRDQVSELQSAVNSRSGFVDQIAPQVLNGTLQDKSVVVVSGPGAATKDREAVVKMLHQASATITGSVRLNPDFVDPKRDDTLHDLASKDVPSGVELPDSGSGIVTASALLAQALTKDSISDDERTTLLQAYTGVGVLTPEGTVKGGAQAIVVVLGTTPTDRDADARTKALVKAVTQFDDVDKRVVVAAPSAGGDTVLSAIRGDDKLKSSISTVDSISSADSQLATAMATVEKFDDKTGHYGTGNGASSQIPKL